MGTITETVNQLQKLTQKNLDILQAINNSFFTKREHAVVTIDGTNYVIPSFICLENKINSLTENFNNLVYAPKTGEATFQMNGGTRTIELKGYTCTPNRITVNINDIAGFSVEQNDIFKDFLTPNPYIKFDLQSIPNDVTTVNVRKIALKSDTLKSIADEKLGGAALFAMDWAEIWKILSIYKEDEDYVMYDTVRSLPVRQNIGSGVYSIKSIDKDEIDADLEEYITITFNEDLKYKLFDETIEKYLVPGDQLVTFDDSAKVEVISVNAPSKQIKVKVLNGDYLNLITAESMNDASDMAKMKFFSPVNYDTDKYINIPLEEDRYVGIFIAPLNNRLNIQAPWGGGVLVDTNEIRWDEDSTTRFRDYYEENVRNVGDILYEVSSAMTTGVMKYSEAEFNTFTQYKPVIDISKLKVLQINTHLDNSESVKNIRSYHSQKQAANNELKEIQAKITEITDTLASISFNDTTGVRNIYESQLSQYKTQQNAIISNINDLVNSISNEANNSVVPLENAKYRIRGYYNWHNLEDEVLKTYGKHVCGIQVQYRYKNQGVDNGTAISIDDNFVFSDWNDLYTKKLQRVPSVIKGYKFNYPQYAAQDGVTTSQDNGRLNEPSFNQIDIPITQGESVDIRLKIVWDFGSPFVETTSAWSSIVNIPFPEELIKEVQILDIIKENNNDIETNRFNNILSSNGVTSHINDSIIDQDKIFFHKPENIASGFYTAERRIVPLKDKLLDMNQTITQLQDLINGTNASSLQASVIINGIEHVIQSDKVNKLTLPAYDTTEASTASEQEATTAVIQATINLANTSNHTVYLYSMFPGSTTTKLNDLKHSKYDINEFILPDKLDEQSTIQQGVYMGWSEFNAEEESKTIFGLQTANQWITFRTIDAYDGKHYYDSIQPGANSVVASINPGDSPSEYIKQVNKGLGFILYPYIADEDALKIFVDKNADGTRARLTINAGETYIVPIICHYNFFKPDDIFSISKTISFDIRTSLYEEPINYVVELTAKLSDTIQEKVTKAEKSRMISGSPILSNTKYTTIIKN